MIIGIDASRANQERRTGVEWYAFQLINELIRQSNTSDRIILYTKGPLVNDWPTLPAHVQLRILNWPPKYMWTQFRLAWEMLWHAPDILFVPAHTIPILCPRKTIATLHDVGFEFFPELYSDHTIGPRWLNYLLRIISLNHLRSDELSYHRWSTRLALRKALRIITVSEFSKKEISTRFDVSNTQIDVVYCGYNAEYHPASESAKLVVKERLGLHRPFLLFIGRIEKKKNVVAMIKAFEIFSASHPSYDFVLVGNPGYGSEEIEHSLMTSPVHTHIRRLGWISDDDMPIVMSCADAFIFVTAYEGFGIPNLEAMACDVPVLTSNQGATQEIVNDAALTVDPHNHMAIARGMERIITDKSLRQALIQKGRERLRHFSWQKAGSELLELVRSLR